MSAPATNAFSPAPVSTTARTSSSSASAAKVSRRRRRTSALSAFSFSGRSSVTSATCSPGRSTRTGAPAAVVGSLIGRASPGVESLSALLTQPALGDHAPQELRRGERLRAELLVEVLRDAEAHVEPDQVGQPERTHRVTVPELHRLVDVLGAR